MEYFCPIIFQRRKIIYLRIKKKQSFVVRLRYILSLINNFIRLKTIISQNENSIF
jgi:hypothetical protein